MTIIGHGVDLVDVQRIRAMLDEHRPRFLQRVFTPEEQAYCDAKAEPADHYAARFAAKEAVLKALGKGWADGIAWTDIGVTHDPSGRPRLVLAGAAADHAARLGVRAWHLSLSHTAGTAVASVVAEG
jgi:holo-[acyl-carrier protein] synthase